MYRAIIGINTDFGDKNYRILDDYVDCVIAAGALPLLVPCGAGRKLLDEYVGMADGFLFIGGKDYPSGLYGEKPHPKSEIIHPRRSGADLYLARAVLRRKMPVLGICGGCQLINIASGGKIIQHIFRAEGHQGAISKNGKRKEIRHKVKIAGKSILGKIFGQKEMTVNSYHHQAVDADKLGRGLRAAAFAGDGALEAVEGAGGKFLLGVQWHPERMPWKSHGSKVFGALVRAAGDKS